MIGCWLALAALPALSLEGAIELARRQHEAPQIAAARTGTAEARLAAARALFFPTLTATGSYTRRPYATEFGGRVLQDNDALLTSGGLQLSLFDARAFPLYRQASYAREAAVDEATEVVRTIAFETAQAFLVALGAEQVLQAAERRVELATRSLRDARQRAAAQLVGSNDVTRAELEAVASQQAMIRARSESQLARRYLGFLIAESVEGELEIPETLLNEAVGARPQAEGLLAEASRRRRDLRAARKRVEALDAGVGEALARLLPRLAVQGEYHWTDETGFSGRNSDGSASLVLSWTLFDGGLAFANRREGIYGTEVARLELERLARQVETEVGDALIGLATAQEAARQGDLGVRVATRNATEVAELYRRGLAQQLLVVDAAARLFEAEVELARARFGVGRAFLELRAALGQGPLGNEPS